MTAPATGSVEVVDGLAVHRRAGGPVTVVFVHGAADRAQLLPGLGGTSLACSWFATTGGVTGVLLPPDRPQVTTPAALLASQIDDVLSVIAATTHSRHHHR